PWSLRASCRFSLLQVSSHSRDWALHCEYDCRSADGTHPVRLEAGNSGFLRIDHPEILGDLEMTIAGLADVHVHANMMLAGHHLGRPARALGDLGVFERGDDVILTK